VDAAKSIPYAYAQMVNNATDSYAMGEVFDGDAGYACLYQANGLDGFLNFPVYFQVSSVVIFPMSFLNGSLVMNLWL
jgi:hypothetical protein